MAPYKNDCGEKKWGTQCKIKKWIYKMTVGAKQVKKMAPYKNDSGQKKLNQTA